MEDKEFLSINELARLLGVSRSTVNTWRASEIGPPEFKVDRAVRFRRSDVDKWVDLMLKASETA